MALGSIPALVVAPFLTLAGTQDWYVDAHAPGCATGTGSQADPFCTIGAAVAAAVDGDRLHVAPGTYFENVFIGKDLELRGTGGADVTTVDGGMAGSVVRVVDSTVVIAGLTLTNGRIDLGQGGGLCAQGSVVTLMDSIVSASSAEYGGGVYSDGSLNMIDVRILGNSAVVGGGGCFMDGITRIHRASIANNSAEDGGGLAAFTTGFSTLAIVNTQVCENAATADGGGVWGSRVRIGMTSVVVTDNSAGDSGGGIYAICFTPLSVRASTISGNSAFTVGGIRLDLYPHCFSFPFSVTNSIVWGNEGAQLEGPVQSVTYSCIEGGWTGTGNIGVDPLFVDAAMGDYRLMAGSPCIDAGNSRLLPRGGRTDQLGQPRYVDDLSTPDTGVPGFDPVRDHANGQLATKPIVDMGAIEHQ